MLFRAAALFLLPQPVPPRPRPAAATFVPTGVLLKVNIANLDENEVVQWLMQRGWASVLPMQPMLWGPIEPSPPYGVELTFRRKPTDEKGGTDGGLRFVVEAGTLLVTRISEGQAISKSFSERILVEKTVKDLERLPAAAGQVTAVLYSNMMEPT